MTEAVLIAGRERTQAGWLLWEVELGPPGDRRQISWPGLGEIDFTTVQSLADPIRRASMRLVEVAHDVTNDEPLASPGLRLIHVSVGRGVVWIAVMIPSVGDFDDARGVAIQETGATRLLLADEDPDSGWWIGVLSAD